MVCLSFSGTTSIYDIIDMSIGYTYYYYYNAYVIVFRYSFSSSYYYTTLGIYYLFSSMSFNIFSLDILLRKVPYVYIPPLTTGTISVNFDSIFVQFALD